MGAHPETMDLQAWRELERQLAGVIPVYERVNRLMSLGLVGGWRRRLVARIPEGGRILEVGAGPGQLAAAAGRAEPGRYVLLDPLPEMMRHAKSALAGPEGTQGSAATEGSAADEPASPALGLEPLRGSSARRYTFVVGLAEGLPFPDASFDAVCCSFSYRDFLDKRKALAEFHRVLSLRGVLLVLDVAKPEGRVAAALRRFYVKRIVPALGRLASGRHSRGWKGNPYAAFAATYDAFGTPAEHVSLAREAGFRGAKATLLVSGGAFLLEAEAGTVPEP